MQYTLYILLLYNGCRHPVIEGNLLHDLTFTTILVGMAHIDGALLAMGPPNHLQCIERWVR